MKLDDMLQYFGYVMIKFLFYTGLMSSEMQALQWSDFDDTKNSTSNRLVALDNNTFNMILKWHEYQKTLFEVKKDTFIFSYDD